MAFGFGFNKQKVLSAAEKFVQQGKLQNAIAEYEKVLQHDAKDLTVNNTIGDLYARLGDSAKAIECFKTVGDAYAAQGFTVKGIAMYKKITKLQPSMDASLKLAELYTQQGLFNDARAQYLQVAEDFMKRGDLEQAVAFSRRSSKWTRKMCPCGSNSPKFTSAWERRKKTFHLAQQLGCNKIALGHHKDDIIETLLLNIFYGGTVSTMLPLQTLFKGKITLIRPLALVEEKKKRASLLMDEAAAVERMATALPQAVIPGVAPLRERGEFSGA